MNQSKGWSRAISLQLMLHAVPLDESQSGNEKEFDHPPLEDAVLSLPLLLVLTGFLLTLHALQLDELACDVDEVIYLRFHSQDFFLTDALHVATHCPSLHKVRARLVGN